MNLVFHIKFIYNFIKFSFIKKSLTLGLVSAYVDTIHNFDYTIQVLEKAKEYDRSEYFFNPTDKEMLKICSLFHNSYNHKEEKKWYLRWFLFFKYGREFSISFFKNEYVELSFKEIQVRTVVSDADKIFSLGEIGYERCYTYATETLGIKIIDCKIKHIIQHCFDNLFLLPMEFKTMRGKEDSYREVETLAKILYNAIKQNDINV